MSISETDNYPSLADVALVEMSSREALQGLNPDNPSQGIVYTRDQLCELATDLVEFGMDYIEVGVPTTDFSKQTLKALIEITRATHSSTQIVLHCRCNIDDLNTAVEIDPNEIELYLGSSPENRQANGDRSIEDTIRLAGEAISHIRKKGFNKPIRFSPEDTYRTPHDDLIEIITNIAPQVQRIGLPDTTGGARPKQVARLVAEIIAKFKLPIQIHAHNDLGVAVANYNAALEEGATVFDTSIMGFGERNGTPNLPEVVGMLVSAYGEEAVENKYKVSRLVEIVRKVANYHHVSVPYNMPFAGEGCFVDGSGVHANAMRNNVHSYSILTPQKYGRKRTSIYASAVVGGANVEDRVMELGYTIDKSAAKAAAKQIRESALEHGGISAKDADIIIFQYLNYDHS